MVLRRMSDINISFLFKKKELEYMKKTCERKFRKQSLRQSAETKPHAVKGYMDELETNQGAPNTEIDICKTCLNRIYICWSRSIRFNQYLSLSCHLYLN